MKQYIQIGGEKEVVVKDGFGAWQKEFGQSHWLVKQTITTQKHVITVGEFLLTDEQASSLFNMDRDDGPFIVKIGGANIEEHGDNPTLVPSETKKPAIDVLLPNGTVAQAHSWIEFADGQQFFAHVLIETRKTPPPNSNATRETWWQRVEKRVGECKGNNKDDKYDEVIDECCKIADKLGPNKSDWDFRYLPDDAKNKEKNPRKLIEEFVEEWREKKITTDGAKQFRKRRRMWLMKRVQRAKEGAS